MSTRSQMQHWTDGLALFDHALRVTPDNAFARTSLGLAYASIGKVSDATAHFQRAVELKPSRAQGRFNLANHLAEVGDLKGALEQCRLALELSPNNEVLHNNYGVLLASAGDLKNAAYHYLQSISLNKAYPKPYFNYGTLLHKEGRPDTALEYYQKAASLDPEWVQCLVRLAWIQLACQTNGVYDPKRALQLCQRADALAGGRDPAVCEVLAYGYAVNGDFMQAQEVARRAVELLPPGKEQDSAHLPIHADKQAYADCRVPWRSWTSVVQ